MDRSSRFTRAVGVVFPLDPIVPGQVIAQRVPVVARAGVDRDKGGLVDQEQVLVLKGEVQRTLHRFQVRGRVRRQPEGQCLPCCRPVVQKDPLAVQQNAVGQVFDLLDETGEQRQSRRSRVEMRRPSWSGRRMNCNFITVTTSNDGKLAKRFVL